MGSTPKRDVAFGESTCLVKEWMKKIKVFTTRRTRSFLGISIANKNTVGIMPGILCVLFKIQTAAVAKNC